MSDETTSVAVTVLGIEPVRGNGTLLALVSFAVDIGDVPLRIQGAQLRRHGRDIELVPPCFKSANGTWLPSILMDDAIWCAVLAELGDEWPPKVPSKFPAMVTAPPADLVTISFAPRVEK